MKSKFYLCILLWIALLPVSYGQHTITSASDVIAAAPTDGPQIKTAAVNNHVYLAQRSINFLRNFDGSTVTHHPYPVRAGIQTDLYGYQIKDPMEPFGNDLYMTLWNSAGTYFYRFNGTSFVSISLPFPVVSNPVFWKGRIHVLGRTGNLLKLMEYDGTTARTLFTYAIPATARSFQLKSAAGFLYMMFNKNEFELKQVVRYNGGSLALELPLLNAFEVEDIIPMPGTQNIIIDLGFHHSLQHFDGTTLRTISDIDAGTLTSILAYNGDFYIQFNYEEREPRPLFRYRPGVTTRIVFPPGVIPEYFGEATVWRGLMYIPVVHPDLSRGVYTYDGTTFSPFFTFPGLVGEELSTYTNLVKRRGNLLMIADRSNGTTAYEYNGTSFSTIHTAGGEITRRFIGDAGCFYGWLTRVNSDLTYRLGKEFAPSCSPVFPVRFSEFETIDLSAYATGRDLCWTGIDIDWKVNPCELLPPFCPDSPAFQITMQQSPGNIAYQKDFNQPFSLQFPLDDTINYRLTVGMNEGNVFDDVLMLNKALVAKGFESVEMSIKPKDREFSLTVKTENDISIPFVLSLLGDSGQVIWEQNFTAPLNKEQIKGTASRPGSALRITPAPSTLTTLQDYGISTITHYPNPTSGKFTIEIQSTEKLEVPVTAALIDMDGNVVQERSFKESGVQQFDVTGQKPGLYILSISAGNAVQKDVIQVK